MSVPSPPKIRSGGEQLAQLPRITVPKFFQKVNLVKQKITFQLYESDNTPAKKVPRLTMYVNPNSMQVKRKKKVTVQYTYGGFVVQHWHDDVITVECTGMLGSFRGEEREHASTYQRFMELIRTFTLVGRSVDAPSFATALQGLPAKAADKKIDTNNPEEFLILPGDYSKDKRRHVVLPGVKNYAFVEMGFGHERYKGVFDSFDLDWNYEQPNTAKYSFNFIAFNRSDTDFDILDNALEAVNTYESLRNNKVLRSL